MVIDPRIRFTIRFTAARGARVRDLMTCRSPRVKKQTNRPVAAAGGSNTCQNRKHTSERARAVGTVHRPSSLQRLWHGQSGTQPSSAIMPASPAVVLDAGSTGYLHCLYRRTRPASILDCVQPTACSTGNHMPPDKSPHAGPLTACGDLLSSVGIPPYRAVSCTQCMRANTRQARRQSSQCCDGCRARARRPRLWE